MTIRPKPKHCFIICPIGKEGSPERFRSDLIQLSFLTPVLDQLGYRAIRADSISAPGIITNQIVDHLLNDGLVIADLTGGNPNVYYELAVRHAVRKPCVQLIDEAEKPCFDLSAQRTIMFNWQDLKTLPDFHKKLSDQIRIVEQDPAQVDSPISQAIDILKLAKSGDPKDSWMAQVISMLERISAEVCDPQPTAGAPYVNKDASQWMAGLPSTSPFAKPAAATQIRREETMWQRSPEDNSAQLWTRRP